MSSEDDEFTLSTMIISDDENDYHELNQEEQIQQIAKQEKQIREAKKRKQALRRKWFKMLLLFHRKNVIKESKRFEKHKQNLINQCIELTSKTFISKTIFNNADISIASKSTPSILPIRVLKHRPHFIVNTTKKIDRTANNAAYTLDIKNALLSLWPQALDTISPVVNLGISIPPLPNKLSDADDAAPGAALNALPTVPPYTPEQAVSPLLDFIPVDYSLRREQRPYTAAAKAVEALFAERAEKQNQKLKGKSNANQMQAPLFFQTNDLSFLKQNVADEFEELRNLEFTFHENDDDNIDEYSSGSSDDEKDEPVIMRRERHVKISKRSKKDKEEASKLTQNDENRAERTKKRHVKSKSVPERESYSNNEEEEEIQKVEMPTNFVFDTSELQNIINMKCLNFIDDVVIKEVAKRRINLNTLESVFITKPLLKFTDYFTKEILPLNPSTAIDNCQFNFLSNEMDKSLNKFLNNLLSPQTDDSKNKKGRKEKQNKHKKNHHHRRFKEDLSKGINDQPNDDEAFYQAEAL